MHQRSNSQPIQDKKMLSILGGLLGTRIYFEDVPCIQYREHESYLKLRDRDFECTASVSKDTLCRLLEEKNLEPEINLFIGFLERKDAERLE